MLCLTVEVRRAGTRWSNIYFNSRYVGFGVSLRHQWGSTSPMSLVEGKVLLLYSHSNTVPSTLPVTRVAPSGLNDMLLTLPVYPVIVWSCSLVFISHKCTLPPLQLARVALSGLNDTPETSPVCPVSRASSLPVCASYLQTPILTQVASVNSSSLLKFQQGNMCIKMHYTRRLSILPDPKPQRGDMFIEYQAPNSPKAPEGRHV